MDYLIHSLFEQSEVTLILEKILSSEAEWDDGKKTAGDFASRVKQNLQIRKDSPLALDASESILGKLRSDKLLKSYCLPKKFHGIVFSKTSSGGGYGTHIDNAYMSTGRSDLSFTIFLNNSSEYDGGELCIETFQESKKIKLNSGQILVYPSSTLHSVEKVTRGQRLVAIGWIQSYISSNDDRSLLFGLDAGARGLLAQHGQSPELDLVFQSYNNLLRRLGD